MIVELAERDPLLERRALRGSFGRESGNAFGSVCMYTLPAREIRTRSGFQTFRDRLNGDVSQGAGSWVKVIVKWEK